MSIRRSSRLKSTQNSPTRDRYNAKPRLRTRRGRSSLKETDSNESKDCDIIDLINKNPNKSHVPEHKTSTEAVGFLSYGLDESNDESDSESSSIASGPSTLCYDNREELYCHLCSPCHKLYEKAKRLKEPVKNKLLNNGLFIYCILILRSKIWSKKLWERIKKLLLKIKGQLQ